MDRSYERTRLLTDDPLLLREHLLESLKERWQGYRKAVKRCRKKSTEPSVHRLRVETRRLLSTLALLGCLSSNRELREAMRIVKKSLDAFDELRDTHVQLLFTASMLRDFPELKPFFKRLRCSERALVQPAARKATKQKLGRLRERIQAVKARIKRAFAMHSVKSQPGDRIIKAIQLAFDEVVDLHKFIHPGDVESIHRMRVAFKRFRYMVDLMQPLLPSVSPHQLVAMDQYQTMMGEIQDTDVLIAGLDVLIERKKFKQRVLARFRPFLARRRILLVQSFIDAADQLFTFWPSERVRPTQANMASI